MPYTNGAAALNDDDSIKFTVAEHEVRLNHVEADVKDISSTLTTLMWLGIGTLLSTTGTLLGMLLWKK